MPKPAARRGGGTALTPLGARGRARAIAGPEALRKQGRGVVELAARPAAAPLNRRDPDGPAPSYICLNLCKQMLVVPRVAENNHPRAHACLRPVVAALSRYLPDSIAGLR